MGNRTRGENNQTNITKCDNDLEQLAQAFERIMCIGYALDKGTASSTSERVTQLEDFYYAFDDVFGGFWNKEHWLKVLKKICKEESSED